MNIEKKLSIEHIMRKELSNKIKHQLLLHMDISSIICRNSELKLRVINQ